MIVMLLTLTTCAVLSQPRYDYSRLSMEQIDRGVVAVRQADGKVFVSWRVLRSDAKGQPFDVYRNGKKLNSTPLTQGGSCFVDEAPLAVDAVYEVRCPADDGAPSGQFTLRADAPQGYIPLTLQKPAGGTTPDGRPYTYTANDCSVADVDGDGQYEIIVKWDPSNAHDNAHDGYTGPTLFDCYKLNTDVGNQKSENSQLLWRIDLGRNIRSGAHYVPFIVYDLDGDGRAELMVKTADGTRDALGTVIGDSAADWRHRGAEGNFDRRDEWSRYNRGQRSMTGRILTGPEYISVFDGPTGRVLDTKPYIPERGNLNDWGDAYANRSDRYLAAVGYFGFPDSSLFTLHSSFPPAPADSSLFILHSSLTPASADSSPFTHHSSLTRPSAVFCRGYYTRSVIAAWDWDGRELRTHWVFDTNDDKWRSYAGQGNHNLRVADVDGDGFDEITYGSMAVDNDGRGLYNTGMGHGDALHLMAFDPTTDRLQVWDCHENRRDGSDFRDAATGQVIFQIPSTSDVGRAMAADIDPTNPGVEMWSTASQGIRNIRGERINEARDADDPQHDNSLRMGRRGLSINFGIWWDGDLLRELLDHETVTKYDWTQQTVTDVQHFENCQFNNGTKSNPCLQADFLGDWREEVITRNRESSELRIYTTTIPTDYRITCLMQDIPYRLSVAYQNVGYNQPPEPGFYIGPDRTDYLR